MNDVHNAESEKLGFGEEETTSNQSEDKTKARAKRSENLPLPYIPAPSNVKVVLDKIEKAALPEKFDYDFLDKTLFLGKGSGVRPIVSFLKRIGLLSQDGKPTKLYNEYRDGNKRKAAASALRRGYQKLFEYNERIYDCDDATLREAIVGLTGVDILDKRVGHILTCFKTLNSIADFNAEKVEDTMNSDKDEVVEQVDNKKSQRTLSMKLGYTINLNLPESNDPKVYNTIFKALREQLLLDE